MMKIDTKATIQEHSKWVAEKVAEAKEIGIRNGVDGLKVGHVIAMLFKQNEELEDVLLRNGFRRCDVAACNCGSWHQVTGWPERFREIEEVVQPKNGVTLLAAVTELQDELENYQSDAYVLSLLTKLDELESNRDDVVGNLSRSYTREEEKDKRIAELEVSEKLKQDYFEQCGVLVDIIDKARADPNADRSVESAIDNSYTGQIAQLQKQLEAVRVLIDPVIDTQEQTGAPYSSLITKISAIIGEVKS